VSPETAKVSDVVLLTVHSNMHVSTTLTVPSVHVSVIVPVNCEPKSLQSCVSWPEWSMLARGFVV